MSDVIDYSNSQFEFENLRIGEATAHIIAAASIVEELEGNLPEVNETVRRYVDAWISYLVPIDYVPGMAEIIGNKVNKKITQIFPEITEEELAETLEMTIDMKKSLDNNEIPVFYKEFEVRTEKVLRILGIDLNDIKIFLDVDLYKRLTRLVSILAIAIGISAIWDPKWIVEYQ
ncbi:hypothetical protein [Sulfurisphaera ohwakuensis]|uniref:Uncharacterized protein n=1 Tax=Sulfurisphaera ohwakuensis TaxID=69656 RepID=A0A650CED8_SULOH|nr:hypothetical protein [Sulfurisphaera ohwakuensis]MBB5252905.1 hypothetical protein [Sulfurisphaera ohwakuensis]QGR16164.1 hypothetical protein D1869_02375 [Sulfurisphaera ohwakuensis]